MSFGNAPAYGYTKDQCEGGGGSFTALDANDPMAKYGGLCMFPEAQFPTNIVRPATSTPAPISSPGIDPKYYIYAAGAAFIAYLLFFKGNSTRSNPRRLSPQDRKRLEAQAKNFRTADLKRAYVMFEQDDSENGKAMFKAVKKEMKRRKLSI